MAFLRCNKEVTSKVRLDGKTALVTGSNTGIGKVAALELYKRGCRVIMACRDVTRAEDAKKAIINGTEGVEGVGTLVVVILDLGSFASVRQCAASLLNTEAQINILICNGGVAFCPKALTEDGFETHFAVNHLGHFLLTLLLLPRIIKSAPARIILVSSSLHTRGNINFDDLNWEKSYSEINAYAQTKLANILFTKELAKRLQDEGVTNVTTYALHPGAVNTDAVRHFDTAFGSFVAGLYRHVIKSFYKTPEVGARTTVYCAIEEELDNQTGLYYADCSVSTPSAKARDPVLAKRLWDESIKMVGLTDFNPFKVEEMPAAVDMQTKKKS